MGDFYQTGVITTLHSLGKPSLERLETELRQFSSVRPVALVLPALYSEFEGPGMPKIVEEVAKAKEFMSPITCDVKIVHNDGKRIGEIYDTLTRNGLDVGQRGKGRSAWLAYGYVIGRGQSDVIALHDCDIVTYSREMLARLCYPIVNPNLDYVFCKGFYSRG